MYVCMHTILCPISVWGFIRNQLLVVHTSQPSGVASYTTVSCPHDELLTAVLYVLEDKEVKDENEMRCFLEVLLAKYDITG